MEQLYFSEIIERITTKLTASDDDTLTMIYNQLFENPIIYVSDDLWEEQIIDDSEIIIDDYDNDDYDDSEPKRNNNEFDFGDYDY